MKNSKSFRLTAFNTVLRGWYKELPRARIYQILFGIEYILQNELNDLKFFRVNIPKGDSEEIVKFLLENPGKAWPGKTRPLGVPTAPWRIVLHLWNGFLTLFLENELKRFNHAYMPSVGTSTALKEWVTKVLPSRFVYEFDIKGFFNNVKIGDIIQKLQERGMPFTYALKLNLLLNRVPANLDIDDAKKSKYDSSLFARGDWGFLSPPKTGYTVHRRASTGHIAKFGIIERIGPPSDQDMFTPPKWMDIKEDTKWAPFVDFDPFPGSGGEILSIVRNDSLDKGLPQGAAPSTILSLLALNSWYEKLKKMGIKLLMYADDGFMYSDREFNPIPPDGFEFAESKSKWVKKDYIPLVQNSKFLGVTYDFYTALLRGSTRSGSTLEFGPKQLDVLKFIKEQKGYGTLTEALARSGLWGLTLSKLYNGKWGDPEQKQKAQYLENSFWGSTFNIKLLSRDRGLQRVASTISCEWLEKAIARTKLPKGVSIKTLRKEEISWRNSQEIQINLKDLQEALYWDELWTEKRQQISEKNLLKPYFGFFDPDNKQHVRVLNESLKSAA